MDNFFIFYKKNKRLWINALFFTDFLSFFHNFYDKTAKVVHLSTNFSTVYFA